MVDSGYPKRLTTSNKLEAITALCVYSVILSRKGAIDQLALGFGPLLELAKEHPDTMKTLFVASLFSEPINSSAFKDLIVFDNVQDELKKMFLKYIETEGKMLLI